MWGRADLEKFYSVVGKIAIIILFVIITTLAGILTADADEEVKSPSVIVNFPIVCQDKKAFTLKMGFASFYPTWHGIRNATFLSTLWLRTGGMWVLTEERAKSKTICILASGEDNELLGIGGI